MLLDLVAKCHLCRCYQPTRRIERPSRLITYDSQICHYTPCAIVSNVRVRTWVKLEISCQSVLSTKLADVRKLRCPTLYYLLRADEPVTSDQPCLCLAFDYYMYTCILLYLYTCTSTCAIRIYEPVKHDKHHIC